MHGTLMSLFLGLLPSAADTAVVCPAAYRQAVQPWLEFREKQGHELAVIEPGDSIHELKNGLRRLAREGSLRTIVLVGGASPADERWVPTYLAKASVNVYWGSEPELATDNWFADLDDDLAPDVAIGRLAAATP